MANENEFLLQSLFMGVFITFIYDIIRIFRRVIPHGKFAISVEDILFWIYCAAKVFLMMYNESNGTLRWFAVLGALTGMILYMKLVSPFFVKWISFVLRKILGVVGKSVKTLLAPFLVIGKKAANTANKAKNRASTQKGRLKRQIKNRLTFFLKVLKMNLYNK